MFPFLETVYKQSLFYVKGNRGWANDERQEARRRGSRVWFSILRAPPAILEVKSRLFAVQLKYGVARNQQTVCREMLKCTVLWFHGAKNCVPRGGGVKAGYLITKWERSGSTRVWEWKHDLFWNILRFKTHKRKNDRPIRVFMIMLP